MSLYAVRFLIYMTQIKINLRLSPRDFTKHNERDIIIRHRIVTFLTLDLKSTKSEI